MLNLARLGADAASVDYYIGRTQGCEHGPAMTREALVDYYAGGRESAGVWAGAGAAALGMTGEIDPAHFRELLLVGRTPDGIQRVGPQMRRGPDGTMADKRVAGVDCCFRAPKSVSLLYAFGDQAASAVVRDAHEHAAREALRYLEGVGSYSRRGKAGMGERVPGEGFIAASFRHRDARPVAGADHGDPLLHSHLVVANMVRAEDGQWGALPTKELWRHARTAGFVYQAALRAELTERLGIEWTAVRNGVADVDGIPRTAIEHFSRRRGEITAELARRGEAGAAAAQTATLATREGKAADVDEPTLRDRWEARAAEIGYGAAQVAELLDQAARRDLRQLIVGSPPDLFGADGLTRHASTFYRRDVLRAVADASPNGAGLDELQARTGQLLTTAVVVPVGDDLDQRYTTTEMLAVEAHVLALGDAGRHAGLATVAPQTVDAALAAVPFELGDDQAAMVQGLLTSGAAVEVVQAPAGTGKTTALSAARLCWEAAGYRVVGSSTAARAARELADGGGIAESGTLARLLGDLEHAEHGGFAPRTVLVIDEAGMVGSRVLERVLEVAARDQAKVVLVGDSAQLPEIDAGGSFRGLADRLGAHELTANRRQAHEWERDALTLLRKGEAGPALDRYVAHGRVTVADTTAGARALLAADWWDATDAHLTGVASPETIRLAPVMIAARRVDVADLNGLGRRLMVESGRLTGDTLTADGKDYQAGDRIVCLKNGRRLGVHNGSRATVEAVEGGALSCRLDTGGQVTLPPRYLAAGHVDHAYAITVHKGQGMTTGQAFVLGVREAMYQESGYVAMSRAKDSTRLYLVTGASTEPEHDMPAGPAQDALNRAKWALAQSKAQTLASDLGPARHASSDDLEVQLSQAARLLRTRPPGDAAEWTDQHAEELAATVATGTELAWRGKADRVAVEADPAVRQATVEAPSRSLSRRR